MGCYLDINDLESLISILDIAHSHSPECGFCPPDVERIHHAGACRSLFLEQYVLVLRFGATLALYWGDEQWLIVLHSLAGDENRQYIIFSCYRLGGEQMATLLLELGAGKGSHLDIPSLTATVVKVFRWKESQRHTGARILPQLGVQISSLSFLF